MAKLSIFKASYADGAIATEEGVSFVRSKKEDIGRLLLSWKQMVVTYYTSGVYTRLGELPLPPLTNTIGTFVEYYKNSKVVHNLEEGELH